MMDVEELALFERGLQNAAAHRDGGPLDAALDGLGWWDALASDPRPAIALLFEVQGATTTRSSALASVMAGPLGVAGGPGRGMVLPGAGRSDPPGTVARGVLRVHGLAGDGLLDQPSALVATSVDHRVHMITVPTGSLRLRPIEGVDPRLCLLEVTGEIEGVGAGVEVPAADWAIATALGRLAVAHELVGASRAMLELACEHARGRIQFDRPIASFQAVRHRLAETRVGIDLAAAMLDAAWLDGSADTAAMAKAVAGRQARTAARHGQQVLAGIGFTVEHPFHHYVRRILVLDALLGTAAALTTDLGQQLIGSRRLPPLLPL